MNVDNLENGKNDEKNVQTTTTDQHAQRRKQHSVVPSTNNVIFESRHLNDPD